MFDPEQPYHPKEIEPKWQQVWEEKKIFQALEDGQRPKFYCLEMFPYPSGKIHMGHVRNYTIGDVIARFKRMRGFNVLHPIGYDAFGMPAENAAIEHKTHPAAWTDDNMSTMNRQLKRMGFSYDWDRELATCRPEYYHWEQLVFLKMFEKGLVYKKKSFVNWCTPCDTVLANEQVIDGRCWRCDREVSQKPLEQWFFKITAYADQLLADMKQLSGWPERVVTMQREWIGESQGATVRFPLEGKNGEASDRCIEVFTTRPDTLYGTTFMSLAAEHPMAQELARGTAQELPIKRFAEQVAKMDRNQRLTDAYEKEGVFTGAYCLNPLTGRRMPVYAANFVLADYGTGAVMAVPAHDQRDFEFAKKYQIPMEVVIQPSMQDTLDPLTMKEAFAESGIMVNSAAFNGTSSEVAKVGIVRLLEERKVGQKTLAYKLRDWGISRQRYWGTPIPILHCPNCGMVPVPEAQLPVVLPTDVEFTGQGGSPLKRNQSFLEAPCPKCKVGTTRRETDTMDTFVESSWYFLRYCSPHYDQGPFDPKAVAYWMPVDQYIGGIEHAVLHLLYARFFTKVLRDLGFFKGGDLNEPFQNLLTQGMVIKDGAKMSKSKGNVVDPNYLIEKYGADTARLFSLFAAPPEKDLDWNDQGVEGAYRFLGRVWRLVRGVIAERKRLIHQRSPESSDGAAWLSGGEGLIEVQQELDGEQEKRDLERWLHKTIKKVTEDLERFHFNTAISTIMEYSNFLAKIEKSHYARESVWQAVRALVVLLSPFAPHLAEELWQDLTGTGLLAIEPWPTYDESALVVEEVTLVVQVNGVVRTTLSVAVGLAQSDAEALATADARVKKYLEQKAVVKIIYIPNRLLNIVVK